MKSRPIEVIFNISMILFLLVGFQPKESLVSAAPTTAIVAEGNDFATQVLQDPWDMSEFSDVSQYLNSDDNQTNLISPSVADGIFSAVPGTDPQFYVLFPGYNNTITVGKQGDRFPINTSKYRCMYFAMDVKSSNVVKNDYFKVYWFSDKNMYAMPFGSYVGDVAGMPSTHFWNLYSVDLGATTGSNSWTSRSSWKGLRIDPTNLNNEPGAYFSVDWVRLTDCTRRTYHATWSSPLTNGSIWAQPAGTSRTIRIATGISGTSADLDLEGVQPGTYNLFTGTTATSPNSTSFGSVVVNQAPIVKVTKPSFTSGFSYGSQIGNPWDMSDSQDASTECTSSNFSGGFLNLTTVTGASQPSNCVNGGIADPKIYLNSPQQANTNEYRYFTFRMNTQGAWQKFGKGMMGRFIWTTNGLTMVSWDIPYDVGWNTLTVDLNDSFAGTPVQCYPSACPGGANWFNSKTAGQFRFDPNENISGADFVQQVDWVTLTKMDEVKRGSRFPIGTDIIKGSSTATLTYYYTTTPSIPKQNPAIIIPQTSGGTTPPPSGGRHVFLPLVMKDYDPSLSSAGALWDTSLVTAGTYYICVEASDNYNSEIYCSEAPVRVIN